MSLLSVFTLLSAAERAGLFWCSWAVLENNSSWDAGCVRWKVSGKFGPPRPDMKQKHTSPSHLNHTNQLMKLSPIEQIQDIEKHPKTKSVMLSHGRYTPCPRRESWSRCRQSSLSLNNKTVFMHQTLFTWCPRARISLTDPTAYYTPKWSQQTFSVLALLEDDVKERTNIMCF